MKFLILAASLLLLSACGRQPAVQAKQAPGPISIETAPVIVRQVQRAVESIGTLYPYDESVISAEIDGRVDRVKVDLGDQVNAGDVMVHISDEEQRYLLTQNEAQLHQSLERLGLKNENEKVKDIRDSPDPRRAQADLVDAEQRLKRSRSLVDQGIASQSDLDAAQARFKAAQASYDSTLYQTRNMVSEVERTRAMLDMQRKKLRDTSVRAPFKGFVKERQVTIGQFVRVNTPLVTLVKIDPIRLRLEVPERMAPWVKVGQIVDVSVEAFEGRNFQGKIWRLAPTVDQNKRTFIVEALIQNPASLLKPGS
ncbi:MAG: efflux RND transporter periplasmic adaptor subunit, partial [Acidobacteriota bacterium]|nr:efflux RND transporter periplasmic adaptor subunit [Acidobacteriota bacterium]